MLYNGYVTVYQTIFNSIYPEDAVINMDFYTKNAEFAKKEGTSHIIAYIDDKTHRTISVNRRVADRIFKKLTKSVNDTTPDTVPLIWFVLEYSRVTNTVLDVTDGEFTSDVINSTETDREVLNATVDLLSLLITGNQLVLC